MNFCGNCGAPATDTTYCTNCGQPLTEPAGRRSGSAQATPTGVPQQAAAAPGVAAPGRAATSRGNPFAAISIGDYVRDGLALLLLLMSLGMVWDFEDNATGKVYVILAALLSIMSLSLPYLRAASVLPPTLAPAQLQLVRLVANAPYLIVVLVTLGLGYLGDTTDRGFTIGDGVGVGLVIGFVGALLAAQPRGSERGPGSDDGTLWRLIAVGLAGLAVVLGLISVIIFMVDLGDLFEWSELVAMLIGVLLFVGVPALVALGLMRGEGAWRDVAIVLGGVGLMAAFWALGADETMGDVWSLRINGPRFLFWPAIGAAAAAVGVAAIVRAAPGARRWVNLSVRLFETGIVLAGLMVLYFAFDLVERENARGPLITALVLTLIALAATFVGRNALLNNAGTGRPAAMGVAAVLVVVGTVKAAVLGSSDSIIVEAVVATVISAWFVFAVVIAVALTAPKSVRDELGVFTLGQGTPGATAGAAPAAYAATQGPASSQSPSDPESLAPQASTAAQVAVGPEPDTGNAADQPVDSDATQAMPATADSGRADADKEPATDGQQADAVTEDATQVMGAAETHVMGTADQTQVMGPGSAVPDAPAPAEPTDSGYTKEMAADPNTPLQTLADIAAKEPSLRPYIALNPSTYPELLVWLEQLGDPAVDDALRRRQP